MNTRLNLLNKIGVFNFAVAASMFAFSGLSTCQLALSISAVALATILMFFVNKKIYPAMETQAETKEETKITFQLPCAEISITLRKFRIGMQLWQLFATMLFCLFFALMHYRWGSITNPEQFFFSGTFIF